MPNIVSRRTFLTLSTAALSTAALSATALGTALPGAAAEPTRRPGLAAIRIPTAAGTFDAVAVGPPSGRKVLLLHGFPEFGIAWEAQLRALGAAGFRAVAPDQRGYSPGVRPSGVRNYTLDHPVRDVVAMADALGWGRFDLAGHDWGAAVGWIAAARHPDRIRSLTAVSVPHLGAFAHALRTDPEQQRASAYMDMFRQPSPIPEDTILSSGSRTLPGVPPHRSEEYFRRLSEPGALTAALNWYRANDFTGYEERVAVPTLFIAGTRDAMVAPSGVLATEDWVCGPYRLAHLPGLEHTIPEQAPAITTSLMREHLASVPR